MIRATRRTGFVALALAAVLGACEGNINDEGVTLAVTVRANLTPDKAEAIYGGDEPSLSADARFIAFSSYSSNLHPDDTDTIQDIYVKDLQTGTLTLASTDSTGMVKANSHCFGTSISGDGQFVAFASFANNLVTGDSNGQYDIFVKDLVNGTTILVSRASGASGALGTNFSYNPSISSDGMFVAFTSYAENLDGVVSGGDDPDSTPDIYVRDIANNITILVSRATGSGGSKGNNSSDDASISGNGQYVVFHSFATNLPDDTDSGADVFLRDIVNNVTLLISRATGATGDKALFYDSGGSPNPTFSGRPQISGDGTYVVFETSANNLDGDNTGGIDNDSIRDIYLRIWDPNFDADYSDAVTFLVSRSSGQLGGKGNQESRQPSISGNGRFITFESYASNLVTGDTNGEQDIFVRDTVLNVTIRVSVRTFGGEGDSYSYFSTVSGDGRFVVFSSYSSNLVDGDNNNSQDIFVRGPIQ